MDMAGGRQVALIERRLTGIVLLRRAFAVAAGDTPGLADSTVPEVVPIVAAGAPIAVGAPIMVADRTTVAGALLTAVAAGVTTGDSGVL